MKTKPHDPGKRRVPTPRAGISRNETVAAGTALLVLAAALAACAPRSGSPDDSSGSMRPAGSSRAGVLGPPSEDGTPSGSADPAGPEPPPYGFASGPEVIGRSVDGRPLEMYRFGFGPVARLIVAGIHGGYEWNTIDLGHELIEYVGDHPGVVPADVTLFLLPVLNPDGDARSHSFEGRANAHGVDLSRNWASGWRADWPRAGCWNHLPITAGSHPASEPEVKALSAFIESHDIDALISYHSAALGIFAGGQPAEPDSVRLAEAIAAVTPYPYPPLDGDCAFTGQFTDWAADHGIAAVDVELTNHTDTDFEINLRVLKVLLEWSR
jgi:hypothetical protein